MLIFALALAAPTALTETHQRDIACVVEIAILADAQKRGAAGGTDVQTSGRRWAGIVGDRITYNTKQPKELVAFAIQEAARARTTRNADEGQVSSCIQQMNTELAVYDTASGALPKPVKAK